MRIKKIANILSRSGYKGRFGLIIILFILSGCSTVRKIPENEVLYTGVKKINVKTADKHKLKEREKAEIASTLSVPPNNPLYSPYVRIPFPLGLWVYNWDMDEYSGRLKKWLYENFAKSPVLISKVDPELRLKILEANLKMFGYFDVESDYRIILNKRNPRKAKISYEINMGKPYTYRNIKLWNWPFPLDSLMRKYMMTGELKSGKDFDINIMKQEKQSMAAMFRNSGYYYFHPEHIEFAVDSTIGNYKVDLRITLKKGIADTVLRIYSLRNVTVYLGDIQRKTGVDSIIEDNLKVVYALPLQLKASTLLKAIKFRPGDRYSLAKDDLTKSELLKLGIFKYVNTIHTPVGSETYPPRLDIAYYADFLLPYEAEVEGSLAYKSNNLIGPGIGFSISNRNFLKRAQHLSFKLRGAYEWQIGGRSNKMVQDNSLLNSYELGMDVNLDVPHIVAPRFIRPKTVYEQTSFQLSGDLLNRRSFFRMISWGGQVNYDFHNTKRHLHRFTPFKLNYTYLLRTTPVFDSAMVNNRAISMSFQNQFIPVTAYTYTYDRPATYLNPRRLYWQTMISEGGNLISGFKYILGGRYGMGKELFNNQYSQFVKLTSELILQKSIKGGLGDIAARLYLGLGYAYDNSEIMPYSEQFYSGGANSIRAFHIRSIGPGNYHQPKENTLAYLDQTGDMKLEANMEYRFRIQGKFHAALFADVGNVWLLREDDARPGGKFDLKKFYDELAVGVGLGIRYDLSLLVIRLDCGIAIHAPYDTGKKGYYNIPSFFKDGVVLNMAIGYPF